MQSIMRILNSKIAAQKADSAELDIVRRRALALLRQREGCDGG